MRPEEYLEQFFTWYESDDYVTKYNTRRKALRAMFEGYRTATGENKQVMDWLLTAHAELCRKKKKLESKRRHNVFVLRYVAGASTKEAACRLNICTATVCRDVSVVLDDMMVLAFGVAGLIPYEYIRS